MNVRLTEHVVRNLQDVYCSCISPSELEYWLSQGYFALVAQKNTNPIEQAVLVWDDYLKRPFLAVMVKERRGFVVVTIYPPHPEKIWGEQIVLTDQNIKQAQQKACRALSARRY